MNKYQRETLPVPLPSKLKKELLLGAPPFWLVSGVVIAVLLSLVPLSLLLRARVTTSEHPRMHLIQDMGVQPSFGPQAASPVFADGRAMRPPPPGTVAVGQLREDDHYYRGFVWERDEEGRLRQRFFNELPDQVVVDSAFMERGRERYNIFCATCHGMDGHGDGLVTQRAMEIGGIGWIRRDLLGPTYDRENYTDGEMFNVITHGIRSMGPYGSQISVEDRWAIVAYLRALQRSQRTGIEDLEPGELEQLR
ncbi:MAG: cytochrome c [Phycisphaeraceae bacterium]|nr:cytochrome c [Phycisphaeraceae bacterium]